MTRDGQEIAMFLGVNEVAAEHQAGKERRAKRRYQKLAARERRDALRIRVRSAGRFRRAIATAAILSLSIWSGCDEDSRSKAEMVAAEEARARAAQAERQVQEERARREAEQARREEAELAARTAERGRAFWLMAAAFGTVAALVIGTGMRSKALTDLHKQRRDSNGNSEIPSTTRFQGRI